MNIDSALHIFPFLNHCLPQSDVQQLAKSQTQISGIQPKWNQVHVTSGPPELMELCD